MELFGINLVVKYEFFILEGSFIERAYKILITIEKGREKNEDVEYL